MPGEVLSASSAAGIGAEVRLKYQVTDCIVSGLVIVYDGFIPLFEPSWQLMQWSSNTFWTAPTPALPTAGGFIGSTAPQLTPTSFSMPAGRYDAFSEPSVAIRLGFSVSAASIMRLERGTRL